MTKKINIRFSELPIEFQAKLDILKMLKRKLKVAITAYDKALSHDEWDSDIAREKEEKLFHSYTKLWERLREMAWEVAYNKISTSVTYNDSANFMAKLGVPDSLILIGIKMIY